MVLEILGGNADDIMGWSLLDPALFCSENGEGEYDVTVKVRRVPAAVPTKGASK